MKLRHITRYLLVIPLLLLYLATLGYASRAAMARKGKRPPLPAITIDIDKLKKNPSTERHHAHVAEIHFRRSTPLVKPSRFGLHSPQSRSVIGVDQQPWAEEASLSKVNLQYAFNRLHNSNQFLNLLLMAAILLQFGDTLAGQRSSTKADLPTGSSSPVKGSHVEGKSQVLEKSGSEQDIPESSRQTEVEKKSTDDGTSKRNSPVYIEFEPCLGPWIEINEEDQFVATHDFDFHTFKMKRNEVGSVVKLERGKGIVPGTSIIKNVTLAFPTEAVFIEWILSEPSEEIDTSLPTPFWMSPFLLLPKENKVHISNLSNLKLKEKTPIKELRREGKHPFLDPLDS